MKKRIIRIIVLAVVVTAVIFGVQWQKNREKLSTNGDLIIYGTVDIRDANLAFTEQERIAQVLVEEGSRVEAGQVLARLKTDRLEAQIREVQAQVAAQQEIVKRLHVGNRPQEIEQVRAQVAAARAGKQNTQRNYKRLLKISGSGATSEQALDDARSRFDVAQAQLEAGEKALSLVMEGPRQEDIAVAEKQLEALEARLSLLSIRLGDMTLTAPAPGVVQSRILEPGEMAGPTRPVITLALTDPKWIRAYVPEPYLGRIKQGTKAKIQSDSFPGQTTEGWIGFISPVAEFTPKTVQTEELRTKLVYEVRIFVNDPDDRLRLGMPVTVMVEKITTPGFKDSRGRGVKDQK